MLLPELHVAAFMSTRVSSVFLKPFSDLVALRVPQLGTRNGNVLSAGCGTADKGDNVIKQ